MYSDQLNDIRWKRKRRQILERDQFKCTVCGTNKNLQVHHTFYYSSECNAWDYPNKSLLTVCKRCHQKYHEEHELTIKKKPKVKKVKKVKKLMKVKERELSKKRIEFREQNKNNRKYINGEWVIILK